MSSPSAIETLAQFWPGVVFRQRPDWSFEYISPTVEALTGIPVAEWQRLPPKFWEVVHELDAESVLQEVRRCSTDGVTLQYRVRNLRNGHVNYLTERRKAVLKTNGQVAAYEGLWLDDTRRTTAELRLANAGWKETLAVITMGLAHDFNNILAGICSLSDTYLTRIDAQHEFHEGLSLINQNARQASQLVHRIVNVHRGKTGSRSYHDLNEIARDAVELLRKVVPRHVEFTNRLSPTALPLYVDAVEMRQVLINLALNAVEAMPERGRIEFQTSFQEQVKSYAHFAGSPPRTPCCCFTIADTGAGIKARHLETIFDPFFTTKSMNKGSGLGLYNARLFVEKHQGMIAVETEEGAGTTFHLWLPQADFTEADQAEKLRLGRRRSLLLLGPAGKLLDGMAEFLRLHNFQVFAITQGAEEWLQTNEHAFDGVILQVEARDLAAAGLIRSIRQSNLPLKVVLQILGCHQDQMETQFLFDADLLLTPDMGEETILARLQDLFEAPTTSAE